jgi:cold shock protein
MAYLAAVDLFVATTRSARRIDKLHGQIDGPTHSRVGSEETEHWMPTGVVKWYNPTKGFGFIAPDGGGKDVFVHVSAVERAGHGDPQEGDRISYDLQKGRDNRESATNLRAPED